jgi:RNA polymerase sigma-70 factor (ECF subfamily)
MPEWQEVEQNTDPNLLVERAQNGDADAFGELYRLHAPAVFRFLFAHLSDRMDAEDLTVEVFFKVWRSLPNFRQQGVPFIAYLFRIARNTLIDQYRRSKHDHQMVPLEESVILDRHQDPGEAAFSNMERQEIRNLLDQLPEDQRNVLVLRFLGGLSPNETAEVMGKSSGAVRVLQHRALASFRILLGP